MRLPSIPIALPVLLVAAHAGAAEPPYPTTDFSGTWVIQDGNGNEVQAGMHYSASQKAMRMELAPGGMDMHAIRHMDTGDTVVWSSQMGGMGMRLKTPTEVDVDIEPTGETDSVDGESCKVWRVEGGTACLADGNVPLRTKVEGATAELHDLKRGPQDASLFEPPADLNIISIKELKGLDGLKLPNLPF